MDVLILKWMLLSKHYNMRINLICELLPQNSQKMELNKLSNSIASNYSNLEVVQGICAYSLISI